MTREEAIEALTHCVDWAEHIDETYVDNVPVDALRIAVGVLQRQMIGTCRNCKWGEEVGPSLWLCDCKLSQIVGSYTEPDFYCKYWGEK